MTGVPYTDDCFGELQSAREEIAHLKKSVESHREMIGSAVAYRDHYRSALERLRRMPLTSEAKAVVWGALYADEGEPTS